MPVVQNRWLMLAVLFVARTTMALQFQTVASTGPLLRDALGIDFAAFGTLIGLYMLPGIVIALPGGMLGQRFGARRVLLVGLLLMAVGGVMMAVSHSFAAAALARLMSGAGAVLMSVLISKMVTDWFAGREIVAAMAVVISSWPFGLAAGLVLFGPLAAAASWPAVMYVAALAAALALLMVAALYRDPPDLPAASAQLTLQLTPREWLMVIVSGLVWGCFNVGYIVLISFAPEIFAAHGYSVTEAASAVSLVGWMLIPAIPLAGVLMQRTGHPTAIIVAALTIAAAALALLPFVATPFVALAIIILVIGIPAGPLIALPAQVLRVESRAGGMGVFFTCFYVMMGFLPGGAGLARDLSGSPAAPAVFAAGMMLLCLIGLGLFHAAKRMKIN